MDPKEHLHHAERIIGLSRAYWASQALFVAIRLDIFGCLERKGPCTASEAASLLGAAPEATRRLLDALTGMELLHKEGDRYRNTPAANTLLVPGREGFLGHAVHHAENLWPYWAELCQAVQTGKPMAFEVVERAPSPYRHRLEDYLLAMRDQAALLAPALAQAVDLSDCRHLLDLGSGPGEYSRAFAQRFPRLQITLYDHEATIEVVKEWAKYWEDLKGRTEFRVGNFLEEELCPPFYDAIFLSQVIHIYDAPTNEALFGKAFRALHRSGKLVLHDYLLETDGTTPLAASLFSLNMLLGTPAGACYTAAEVQHWMTAVGFQEVRWVPLSPSTSLVVGSKLEGERGDG